jgi:hypothetical protein
MHVYVGYNFGGIGIDTRATGAILTRVDVKILQPRLVDMTTKDAKLQLQYRKRSAYRSHQSQNLRVG